MTSPSSDEEIKAAVRQLWASWTRKPSDEEQTAWVRALRPYWGKDALKQAMRESSIKDDWIPSIPTLIKRMHSLEGSVVNEEQRVKPLTERERRRAERAAVLSMLWLHYELGWSLSDFGGHVMSEVFGRDPKAALVAAKEQYTRETIHRWMADQAALNPAPCDKVLGKYLAG